MANYRVAHYDAIEPADCPCGWSRRAFLAPDNDAASMHLVEIKRDARVHYHKRLTELYYVLEGEGHLEADGDRVPLGPGTAVLIKPLCRHRAVGALTLLIVATPPFDPDDEYED